MKKPIRSMAAALLTALAAAGCGSGGAPSAAASHPPSTATSSIPIYYGNYWTTLVKHAASVHIVMSKIPGIKGVAEDLSLTRSGGIYGLIVGQGFSYQVIIRGRRGYYPVTPDFLRMEKLPASICATMCGKWVPMPASDIRGVIRNEGFQATLPQIDEYNAAYARTVTFDGQPAWLMNGGEGNWVYVAARGPHYMLRIINPVQRDVPGRVDFSGWNSTAIPPFPPASKIVTWPQLMAA